jgi:hypothetical protein
LPFPLLSALPYLPFSHNPQGLKPCSAPINFTSNLNEREYLKRAKEGYMQFACKFALCSATAQNLKICFLFL